MRARMGIAVVAASMLLATPVAMATTRAARRPIVLPPANAQFDYQLGGPYRPAASVGIVDRDRTVRAARGKYSICYVNAYQTQPDQRSFWTRRHPTLLLRNAAGGYVTDPGYPDEILLDTRTAAKRARIAAILGGWFAGCAASGYKAIEPDNLDSWTRSQHLLTRRGNLALARLLVRRAHAQRLAIAQKNTSDVAPLHASIGFDFAVAEECHAYSECSAYTAAYGNRVYEIEYTDNGGLANFTAACAALGSRISIIYRDRDIVPAGTAGYTYRAC
jgi:hypothetical protein